MSNPWVWPYYPAQPYYVVPSSPGGPSPYQPGHQHSRSWNAPAPGAPGSPYSPPVLPLPVLPGPPPPAPPPPQPAPPPPNYNANGYLHPGYPHARRHSFDYSYLQANNPNPTPFAQPWQYYPPPQPAPAAPWFPHTPHSWHSTAQPLPPPQIHTLLNGGALPQYLQLDLSAFELRPYRRIGGGMSVALTTQELDQPATTPELTRLRVICELIPQWPVDLSVSGTQLTPSRTGRAQIPYITLGDVLFAVHRMLHKKISHGDWGQLTGSQETEVARAYTRRFKAFAAVERQQQREGVKKVDYLLRNYFFKGMSWVSAENGVERMKLLVGPPE